MGAALVQSPDARANPKVIAGLRCAALLPQAAAVKTPAITANAQPPVITIHPPPSAFDPFRSTPATTPFPNRTRMSVPMNSPSRISCMAIARGNCPVKGTGHGLFPVLKQYVSAFILELRDPLAVRAPVASKV